MRRLLNLKSLELYWLGSMVSVRKQESKQIRDSKTKRPYLEVIRANNDVATEGECSEEDAGADEEASQARHRVLHGEDQRLRAMGGNTRNS